MIYFAYFHTVMEYGIIFWGDSVESKRIFQLQKRIIRIMTGSTLRISRKTLFQGLEILTLASQYIFSLTLRSLTLYIYMEHLFLMFLDHTQRRSTVGRTPLDE